MKEKLFQPMVLGWKKGMCPLLPGGHARVSMLKNFQFHYKVDSNLTIMSQNSNQSP